MGLKHFSYDEIARYLWLTATQTATLAEAEVARMIYWCKSPNNEAIPDLVEMISLYAEACDCSERLDQTPIVIDDDVKEELEKVGVLSIEATRNKCAELDGFMISSESFKFELYQRTLNQQLQVELANWRRVLTHALQQSPDEEELSELLSTRDYLEYARIGLHVIRMESRLSNVQYDQFTRELTTLDQKLRTILQDKDKHPLPYAPSTAWWRK